MLHISKELVLVLVILITVSFATLMERKLLSLLQIRQGPMKCFYMGILQSFSDVLKLFSKTFVYEGEGSNRWGVYGSPVFLLMVFLLFWESLPMSASMNPSFMILFFLLCLSMNSYPIVYAAWFSNNKYSLLSCYRTLGQMVSYELCIVLVLLCLLFFTKDLDLGKGSFSVFLSCLPLVLLSWLVCLVMELNRTPFDFSESESELVCGYLMEYGGFLFSFFFLSEYGMMVFFSMMSSYLFASDYFHMVGFILFLVWVRGLIPRTRYDKQMKLAWKTMLPGVLFLSMVSYFTSIFVDWTTKADTLST